MNCADASVSGRIDGGTYTPFYYYGVPSWNFLNYGTPSNEEYKDQGIDANAALQQNYHPRQPTFNRPRYAAPPQPRYGAPPWKRHYTNYNNNTYHNHYYQQTPHKNRPFRNGFVRPHFYRSHGQSWPRYSHNYGVVKKEHQNNNHNNTRESMESVRENKCGGDVCVKIERLKVKPLDVVDQAGKHPKKTCSSLGEDKSVVEAKTSKSNKIEVKKKLPAVEVKNPVMEKTKKVVPTVKGNTTVVKESGTATKRSSVTERLTRVSGKQDPKKKRSSLVVPAKEPKKTSKPKTKPKKEVQLANIEDVPEVAHEEIIPFSEIKVENRIGLNVDSDRETVKICESSDDEALHPPCRVSRRIFDSDEENSPRKRPSKTESPIKPKKSCPDNIEAQTDQLKEPNYEEMFRDIQAILSTPPKIVEESEENLLELLEDKGKNKEKEKPKDKTKEKPKKTAKINKERLSELFGPDPEEELEKETPVHIHIANEDILFETDYIATNFQITPTETHSAKVLLTPLLHEHITMEKPDIYLTITKTQTKKEKQAFPVKCEEFIDLTNEETIKTEPACELQKPKEEPLCLKISRTILPFLIVALDLDKKIHYKCSQSQLDLYFTNLKSVIEALFKTIIREDWPVIHDFKEVINELVMSLKACNVYESMEAMTAPFYKYLKVRDERAPRSAFEDAFLNYLLMVWRKINYNPDVAQLTTEQRNILIYQIKMNNELIEKDLTRLRFEEMLRKNEEKRVAEMSQLTQIFNNRLTTMYKKQQQSFVSTNPTTQQMALHSPVSQHMALQSAANHSMHQNNLCPQTAQMQMLYQMQMQNNQRMVSTSNQIHQMKKMPIQKPLKPKAVTSGGHALGVNTLRAMPAPSNTNVMRNLLTSKSPASSTGTFVPPTVTTQKPEQKNQEKPSMSFRFDVESATLVPDTRYHYSPSKEDNFKIKLPLKTPLRDFSKKKSHHVYEDVTPPIESDSDSENLHIKEELLAPINMEKFGDKVIDLSWLDDLKSSDNTQSKNRNSEDILKEISDAILKKNDDWINKSTEQTKKTATNSITSANPLFFMQDTPPPDDADATDFYRLRERICLCGNAAVFLCTNCMLVMYCSEECQKRHWPLHKRICFQQQKKDPNLSKK